jgi:hypothetical protein
MKNFILDHVFDVAVVGQTVAEDDHLAEGRRALREKVVGREDEKVAAKAANRIDEYVSVKS